MLRLKTNEPKSDELRDPGIELRETEELGDSSVWSHNDGRHTHITHGKVIHYSCKAALLISKLIIICKSGGLPLLRLEPSCKFNSFH